MGGREERVGGREGREEGVKGGREGGKGRGSEGREGEGDGRKTLHFHLPLQNSGEVDINMLGLLALYSEVHPTVSYIVHYGQDILAPVYKLQVRAYNL